MGVIKKRGITYAGGGGADGVDYSTTEQKTGRKWIDGKDVYIRTSPNHHTVLPYNETLVDTGIEVTGDIIAVYGSILRDGEPINFGGAFSNVIYSRWMVRNNKLYASVNGMSNETYSINYITAEYTHAS